MLRKKATLVAYLGLHGSSFQKEGLRAIDAIFLRDGTSLQGRAVGWDSTSTSGKTPGERGLGFRRPPLDIPRHSSEARYQTSERGAPRSRCLSTQIFSTKSDGYGCRIPCGTIALRNCRIA
jgi:hypothetical protein